MCRIQNNLSFKKNSIFDIKVKQLFLKKTNSLWTWLIFWREIVFQIVSFFVPYSCKTKVLSENSNVWFLKMVTFIITCLSTFLNFGVWYSFIRIPEGCGYCKISLYFIAPFVWIKLPLIHLVIKLNNCFYNTW